MADIFQRVDRKINDNVEWVFFDFFDTIVHRKVHTETIKRRWCYEIIQKFQLRITSDELYQIRKQAEFCVSHEKSIINREYRYEELCTEIYLRLKCRKKGKSLEDFCSEKEFSLGCLKTEELLETDNLYLDTEIIKCINLARHKSKNTAVVSDFYLSKHSIIKILEHFNIHNMFDEYFISCDYGKHKSDGQLYQCVLKQLDVSPEHCLMIGDNYRSDYLNAKKLGIHAVYYKCDQYAEKLDGKKMNHIFNMISNDLSHYSNYAFSLYLFLEKLYMEIDGEGIGNILFLSREGQYLKEIFQYYLTSRNLENKVKLHYFYTSRIASYTAGLKMLETEDFHTIFNRYPDISVYTFLSSIGFSQYQIEATVQGKADLYEKIPDFRKSSVFYELLQNGLFRQFYEENRISQKNYLEEYLEQLGIQESELYLVDVGWRGTIQDNLFEAFDRKRKVTGYYIGLSKVKHMSCNNIKIGLLFSEYPVKTKYFDVWNFDKFMYERILLADHPTTVRYQKVKGEIVPVFKEYNEEDKAYQYVRILLNEILEKIKIIDKTIIDNWLCTESYEAIFLRMHLKMVMLLDFNCIEVQKKLYKFNFETFGEFTKTKTGSSSDLTHNLNNISFRKIIKNGFNLRYINGISFTTFMVNKKYNILLIPFFRLLYRGELRRIRRGDYFEYEL